MARMWTPSRDTDPKAWAVQLELLRAAGLARRGRMCLSMSAHMISMSRRAVRQARPELSEAEALLEWVAINYGRDLAEKLRDRV